MRRKERNGTEHVDDLKTPPLRAAPFFSAVFLLQRRKFGLS